MGDKPNTEGLARSLPAVPKGQCREVCEEGMKMAPKGEVVARHFWPPRPASSSCPFFCEWCCSSHSTIHERC